METNTKESSVRLEPSLKAESSVRLEPSIKAESSVTPLKACKRKEQAVELERYYQHYKNGSMSLREAVEALSVIEGEGRIKISHESLRRVFKLIDRGLLTYG